MRHVLPLPAVLGENFSLADAGAHGVTWKRASSADLARPFHGVRATKAPTTFDERVAGLLPRLRPGQLIAGSGAIRAWGLPHPVGWTSDESLEIVVPTGASRVRTKGVVGRRLASERVTVKALGPIPLVDPLAAIFMRAADFTVDQLVILLDAVVTDTDAYPDRCEPFPRVRVDEIDRKLQAWGRFPGRARVIEALSLVREGVESPNETETRLLIVAAGLPEPVVQYEVMRAGRLIARVDLAYPDLRIAIEYEGDGHRTDKRQWRRDIQRQRALEDEGWIVIRLTELDLRDGGAALIARIRRAIAGC